MLENFRPSLSLSSLIACSLRKQVEINIFVPFSSCSCYLITYHSSHNIINTWWVLTATDEWDFSSMVLFHSLLFQTLSYWFTCWCCNHNCNLQASATLIHSLTSSYCTGKLRTYFLHALFLALNFQILFRTVFCVNLCCSSKCIHNTTITLSTICIRPTSNALNPLTLR